MLTLLTATGCRPEAFAICQALMMAQNYEGKVHWVIVDDGETPQPITFERKGWTLTVVRPEPFWELGQNTQARNLREGMKHVNADDRLVIIEDDDCYDSNYLSMVNTWLDKSDLVGECMARYYNLSTGKHKQLNNTSHASLCSTAMKNDAIKVFTAQLKDKVQFIDINLWRYFIGEKRLYPSKMVVGVKGLAGRKGIGMGHKSDFSGSSDKDKSTFKKWVGVNAGLYEY